MSDNKEHTYYVETLFNRVKMEDDKYLVSLDRQLMSFTNEDKSQARQSAQKYFDEVMRYGLKMSGGSVVLFKVHPSAILQVSIIDNDLEEEFKASALEENS